GTPGGTPPSRSTRSLRPLPRGLLLRPGRLLAGDLLALLGLLPAVLLGLRVGGTLLLRGVLRLGRILRLGLRGILGLRLRGGLLARGILRLLLLGGLRLRALLG